MVIIKGKKLSFTGFGVKGGLTYKLSGKHVFNTNAGYISRAPFIQNTYSNSRENHNIVPNISSIVTGTRKHLNTHIHIYYVNCKGSLSLYSLLDNVTR